MVSRNEHVEKYSEMTNCGDAIFGGGVGTGLSANCPLASPGNANYVLKKTHYCQGSYVASSMGKLQSKVEFIEQTRIFKQNRQTTKGAIQ